MVKQCLLLNVVYILKEVKNLINYKNLLYIGLKDQKGNDCNILNQITFRVILLIFLYYFRLTNGNQISLFFDMSDTGILNMDMEFIKYLINLCKSYYPNFLNYIIIFEMPWILNTAFKIIKSWLPPKAIPKIKFVHKGNIHELVDPNDVLTCWGGSNEYLFKFVSEAQNNIDTTMNGKFDSRKVCI